MHPLLVALTAFTVVLVAMTLLTVVFVAFRRLAGRLAPAAAAGADAVPPALLAVLTAAASEALGTAVRLHRVHVHRGPVVERWSRAGRMDIMISHRVEPRR
jgi:hypothetical protein